MAHPFRSVVGILFVGLLAPPTCGDFHLQLPQSASAKKGDPVTFTYRFGHPFEHQIFDAPLPASVLVIAPDGKQTDVSKTLEKIKVPGEKKEVTAYRFQFKPEERGDYTVVL